MLRAKSSSALFWKLWLISGLLHVAIFRIPWPQKPFAQNTATPELSSDSLEAPDAIAAVSLPEGSVSGEESADEQLISASPGNLQLPATSAPLAPSSQVNQFVELPTEPQPAIQQPIQQAVQQPLQQQSVQMPGQQPVESGELLPPQPNQSSESVEPSANPEADPAEAPVPDSPLGTEPEYGKVMPLSDEFPHLAGAQAGCYGLSGCRQLSANFREAANQLTQQLIAKGYEITKREDLDSAGHQVFEAIAPEEPNTTYYLNVFSPDVGSTVYVITTEILTLDALKLLSS